MLSPLTTLAAEKIKGTSFFVVDQQNWETGKDTGYWMWHGKGVSQFALGPFETLSIECHGAGFWAKDESWGEGICVQGAGDDTFTSDWKRDKGQKVGQWSYLSGTGKYAGITGKGTYISTPVAGDRHMSEWEGEVTFAE